MKELTGEMSVVFACAPVTDAADDEQGKCCPPDDCPPQALAYLYASAPAVC